MLNNGGLSGGSSCSSGMGTPDGPNGGMYGGSGASPSEYPPAPSSNPSSMSNNYHPHYSMPPHPHQRPPDQGHPMGNGMMGHHAGGICSQMGLNQGACPQDTKMRPCGGCGEVILDKVLYEAWDKYWHHSCLKCSMCHQHLVEMGPSCFNREGMMLCKQDYLRMFGGNRASCRGCGQLISSHEMVMRAGLPLGGHTLIYHVSCFVCSKCTKTLSTGDRYSIIQGAVLCEQDALKAMKQNGIGSPSNPNMSASNGPANPPRKGKVGRPRRSRD